MDSNQSNNSSQSAASQSAPAATEPAKKSKKGLIVGIIAGASALVIGLIVILLVVLLGGVSQDDYDEARSVAIDLRTPYSKLATTYISSYSTDAEIKKSVNTLKTNREIFNDNMKELSSKKAIKNDKEAKELFAKLTAAQAKLDEYLDIAIEYYEVIFPVAKEMSSLSLSDQEEAIAALEEYKSKLAKLDIKQKINKEYVGTINEILPEFIDAIEAYANATRYDSALYRKVSDLSSKLSNADRDYKSDLGDAKDAADEFRSIYNDLGEYLTDKTNGE